MMKIFRYYILAKLLVGAYYLGDYLGITVWGFSQPTYILLPVLVAYYGTVLLILDNTIMRLI
jgi:hypothetical protein